MGFQSCHLEMAAFALGGWFEGYSGGLLVGYGGLIGFDGCVGICSRWRGNIE